jgi:uncharacterized repeat protein (TIGR03803 family)
MQIRKFSVGLAWGVSALVVLLTGARLEAQTFTVLHDFSSTGNDASEPSSTLIFDTAGDLYGTSSIGGTYNSGAIFKLTPKVGGGWTEKVVHSFNVGGEDGAGPVGGFIFDAAGNFYGTTSGGGAYGYGTVYELERGASGGLEEKILHRFGLPGDGQTPLGGLTLDAAGNLYGTTSEGGLWGDGTAFELTPDGQGGWKEKIIHSFRHQLCGCGDGYNPRAGLISDAAGNLYGTTFWGGDGGAGTVFELMLDESGGWTETVLYSFLSGAPDSQSPAAGLIFDSAGDLYGTLSGWASPFGHGPGAVFELSPGADGTWTEQILHNFCSLKNCADGSAPYSPVALDAAGNLYGTTTSGPAYVYVGVAFELTPESGGTWAETVLHTFCSRPSCADGSPPNGLTLDGDGNLYGTAVLGGLGGGGVVFEIAP